MSAHQSFNTQPQMLYFKSARHGGIDLGENDAPLQGRLTHGCALMTDLRNFTPLCEVENPVIVLGWLKQYFAILTHIIRQHGGMALSFGGDSLLAWFSAGNGEAALQMSAYRACNAAAALLRAVRGMNIERMERGEPQFLTGIGVNPGSVAVGVLEGDGAGRHYVLIGDTVNVTSRLQAYTRSLGESAVILSHHTVTILGACSAEFHLETLGEQHFNGKSAPILIYRLREHSHHAAPFYL